jgi:LysR family nitrogen assimilation transcriptional regulator
MELRQLRYFVAVAEARSFTAAAHLLHVSQPALGMQIRKLEDELGLVLFFRHSRGVALTEGGRVLLDRARRILLDVEETHQALTDLSGPARGNVALGVTPSVGRVLVPDLLDRCRDELPGIRISVLEGMSEEVMKAAAEDRLDLAFSYNPDAVPGLDCTPLLTEDLYLIGARDGGAPGGGTVPFAEVPRYPLILPSRPHGVRVLLENTAAAVGLALDVSLEIDSITMEREMIERALGFTVLPIGVVHEEVGKGRLFARKIIDPAIERTLYLAAPKRRPRSRAIEAVFQLILARVEAHIAHGRWHWRPIVAP